MRRRTSIPEGYLLHPNGCLIKKRVRKRNQPPKERGLCFYCGEVAFTIDHIIPVKRVRELRGKGVKVKNYLVPACEKCNGYKGHKGYSEFKQWILDGMPGIKTSNAGNFRKRFRFEGKLFWGEQYSNIDIEVVVKELEDHIKEQLP